MTVTMRGVNGAPPARALGIDGEEAHLLGGGIRLDPECLADAIAIRPQRPCDRLRDDRHRMLVAFRGRERAPSHDGNTKHVEVPRRDVLIRERDLPRAGVTKWGGSASNGGLTPASAVTVGSLASACSMASRLLSLGRQSTACRRCETRD